MRNKNEWRKDTMVYLAWGLVVVMVVIWALHNLGLWPEGWRF